MSGSGHLRWHPEGPQGIHGKRNWVSVLFIILQLLSTCYSRVVLLRSSWNKATKFHVSAVISGSVSVDKERNQPPQWLLGIRLNSHISWPPLWSSGQSSWLQIQRTGFDFRRYQIFWKVVGLKRGPVSLMSTTEELIERKSSGSGLESRDYCRRNQSRWTSGTLYRQELALTSPTIGVRLVGKVRPRTQATEFSSV
jgi:hypothetical protein